MAYYVMPRYGKDLDRLLYERDFTLTDASIYTIGLKLLNILEVVHHSGLVYNDLKLDNVLIGYNYELPTKDSKEWKTENCFKDIQLHLVDFRFATSWKNETNGQHIKEVQISKFEGNLSLASANQLEFKATSRRDDMHSLVYLIMYLLNDGWLPGIQDIIN